MAILLGIPVASVVVLGLDWMAKHGPRRTWLACSVVMVISLSVALVIDRSPSETSAVALAVSLGLSLILAAGIVLYGRTALGRIAAIAIASLVLGLGWLPGYLIGCAVADWLPGHGCFF